MWAGLRQHPWETRHPMVDFDDTHAYSDDRRYRWWYERRWDDGPAMCWVGLNPSTGDTSGRPRPTLNKVVRRAQEAELSAVIVVNLFSWRATDPADLVVASKSVDIVGARTDETIAWANAESAVTLLAWGGRGALQGRGMDVAHLVDGAHCLGLTRNGQPRHPLYVRSTVPLVPYAPR